MSDQNDDLLQRKEYLAGITIIEARNIQGVKAGGSSSPFVKVRCAGVTQQSQKKYDVSSATWNQSLTFEGIMMNLYELETFEMVIELYDHNPILANQMIGQYSIGLSTLYNNMNHEIYKNWIGLFHQENPNKVQAYLQISCFIIGPNERPPMHSQDEDFGDDELNFDSDEDEDEIARVIQRIQRAQGIMPVLAPSKIMKNFQLNITVDKAQFLCDIPEIKPFVSARVFGMVLKTMTKPGRNPKYTEKLQFPLFYPVLNNKITMRLWSEKGLTQNIYIGNLPEHPDQQDFFNLTKIQSNEGRMPPQWINIYGTKPLDRSNRTKNRKEGSSFLGRVLIAFSMITNERPQLAVAKTTSLKEPKSREYSLWVDLYDFINCEVIQPGAPLYCIISIGDKQTDIQPASYVPKYNKYKWAQKQVTALEKDVVFPFDLLQVPDIFIDFYTTSQFSGTYRFAYLRLKAKDCIRKNPKPTWYNLQSPYNDQGNKNIGMLMTNIQLIRCDQQQIERKFKENIGMTEYKFFCQILHGFEIASCIPALNLNTNVQISIGDLATKQGGVQTEFKQGRYPVWNYTEFFKIKLKNELEFEADMRVQLRNQESGFFGSLSNRIIGEFYVPVQSIMLRSVRPQFFNLLNEEGQFMGQILCNFFIKKFIVDQKNRKNKKYITPEEQIIREEFFETFKPKFNVNIEISFFGVRNLIKKAVKPRVKIRLTDEQNQDENLKEQIIEMNQDWKEINNIIDTFNPNFGKIIKFENVKLAKEPLCWPFIEIQIDDINKEGGFLKINPGCEECFTTLSLVDYAKELVERNQDLMYAREQLTRNQDRLVLIQNQIQDKQFLRMIGAIVDDLDYDNLLQKTDKNGILNADNAIQGFYDNPNARGTLRATVMQNGMQMQQLQQQDQGKGIKKKNLFWDIKTDLSPTMDGALDLSGILKGQGDKNGGNKMRNQNQEGETDDDEDAELMKLNKGGAKTSDADVGIIIDSENFDEIVVSKKSKTKEEEERQLKIQNLDELIKQYQKKLKKLGQEDQISKDKIKIKMLQVTEEIEDLKEENMTEQKFWGAFAMEEEAAFDYGRDTLKDQIYETKIELPYQQIPLFTQSDWFKGSQQQPTVQVSGILRSGNLSGASIKASIKLKEADDEDEDEENSEDKNKPDDKPPVAPVVADNKWEQILQKCAEMQTLFPFDIMNEKYLNVLVKDRQNYKIRVYLLTAQNLTATGTVIDLKSYLAGMTALCTATPFPVIKVGDGLKNDETKEIRIHYDIEKAQSGELNPKFFTLYELDAHFPQDWKLEISIYDKGSFGNSLIGSTFIDLENRLFSNPLFLTRHAIKIEMDENNQKIKDLQKDTKNKKKNAPILNLCKQRVKLISQNKLKAQNIEQILIPIEFRELMHPQKQQAQGIVETWVEVITQEESIKIPAQRMQIITKKKYEIRLVLWETRYVPIVSGRSVNIKVKVTFDPTGWVSDEVNKETDVHNGSKNGWGDFKWRFKFEIETPCDFPRIKFNIVDNGTFADTAIGEAVLNLKKTIMKATKEDVIEVPKTYISVWHPNKPGEDRGILMFSMTILPKEDADADPVGESWDEPNHSPFLKKPTAGRNLMDMLGLGGFDWNFNFSWNPFGKLFMFVVGLCIFLLILTIMMWGAIL